VYVVDEYHRKITLILLVTHGGVATKTGTNAHPSMTQGYNRDSGGQTTALPVSEA